MGSALEPVTGRTAALSQRVCGRPARRASTRGTACPHKKKRRVAEAPRRKGTRMVPLGGDKQKKLDLTVMSADPQSF